jgi:hypothetical protein
MSIAVGKSNELEASCDILVWVSRPVLGLAGLMFRFWWQIGALHPSKSGQIPVYNMSYRETVKHIDSTVLFGALSTAVPVPILAFAVCRHTVVTGNERRTRGPSLVSTTSPPTAVSHPIMTLSCTGTPVPPVLTLLLRKCGLNSENEHCPVMPV